MARDEFYSSPFYLKVATLESRLKQSQPFSEYDLLIMCMYGVDKSFRLAIELNGSNIHAQFLENGFIGLTNKRLMIGNERFHQYAIALDSFPMIALIISELNFGIKAHQETMAKLKNIVLYPNYEDAKLDLLRIYTRHK